ncbi:MAG: hypothetical protein ABR573_00345 [Candidatus Dormibacteria bacterium]
MVALLLLCFPYIALLLLRPAGTSYTGMLFVPGDTFLYLSVMLHSHLGGWTFVDSFTWRQEPGLPILLFYVALGKLLPSGQPAAMALVFHGARLAFAAAFIHQSWKLYGEALPGTSSRRAALLFLLFTAGTGVLALLLGASGARAANPPFDLAFIESNAMYGLLATPHFAAVLLLLAIFLRALLRAMMTPRGGWRATLVAAASAAGLSVIHPEKAGVVVATAGLFWLFGSATGRWDRPGAARRLAQLALVTCAAAPYVAYAYLLTRHDVQVAELLRQGRPHHLPLDPLYYLSGYGLPGLCALAGLPRLLRHPRRAPPGEALLWSFTAAGLVILLAPLSALDHRAEGMQVAVAGLAGRNLVHRLLPHLWRSRGFASAVRARLFGYHRRRLRLLSLNLVIIFSSTTVLALTLGSPRAGLRDSGELFLEGGDVQALSWLRNHAGPDDVVVTGPQTSQFVAAYGGTHVVCCEWAFTPDYDRELGSLGDFFYQRTDPALYLHRRGVRYLYFSSREAAGSPLRPEGNRLFRRVFRAGSSTIYAVSQTG